METIFTSLGCSNREADTLDYLFDTGKPLRSLDVARELEIPRQTAYSILTKLSKQGLVVQTDRNGIKHFYSDTKELAKYIDLERDRLLHVKNTLKGGAGYTVHTVVDSHLPIVHFYAGSLGLRKLFETILDVYKKGKSKKFRGYGINHFSNSKALSDYLQYFVKKRAAYKVATNLFIAKGTDDFKITNESNSFGRTIKHIDIEPQMAGIYLVADRVYLFSYKDNIGVMIENQAIVQMLKDAFDDHWERVKS